MKAYTDLEQSKKLAEILPIESADMCYLNEDSLFPKVIYNDMVFFNSEEERVTALIPCWSLAALIETLPNRINIFHSASGNCIIDGVLYDNFVDACVEMIELLYEQKLL